MVEVQYAEPKVYEPLKIEVLPADSNQPILVKERGSTEFLPAPAGDLARPERGSNHPVNAPPKQTAKQQSAKPTGGFTKSEWKTRRRSPLSSTPTRHRTGIDAVGGLSAAQESMGTTISGFTVGVIDELRNVPLEQAYRDRRVTFSVPEFEGGYEGGRQLTDYVQDNLTNGLELLKEGWENKPNFGLPEFELPTIRFPEIQVPQIDFPKLDLPEFDFPELKRPESELPDTIQPEFELPDWQFDFPTINFPELERDREIEKVRERERERIREKVKFNDTDERIKRLTEELDDGCTLNLQLTRIAYKRPNPEAMSGGDESLFITTPYEPFNLFLGHSNQSRLYTDFFYEGRIDLISDSDSASLVDLGLYQSNEPIFPGSDTYMRVQILSITGITNQSKVENLLYHTQDQRPLSGDGQIFTDLKAFALAELQSNCPIKPDTPPPEIPPIPEKPMDCCNCSDIALIFKSTLQAMRYSIKIPVVSCELEDDKWIPKVAYKPLEIFAVNAATATAQAELYRQIATQAREICDSKNIVTRTSEVIGVDEYPASLPDSLISEDEGFLGNLIPNPNVEIKNITQFIKWFVERFDEVVGQFEIPIEIKDTDPTTPGDQPKGVKIPNISEGMAEIIGLLFQIAINSETTVSIATRTLIEAGQDKTQNFKGYMLLQALTEYIGFNYEDKKVSLPMSFTPGKENLDEMLKEVDMDVAVAEYNDKLNLQVDLARFRKAASIIDSVFFRKIDTRGDTKGQILKYIKDAYELAKKLNKTEGDSFENFIEDAEVGFTKTSGVTDSHHPYGRSYPERPKIKELDTDNGSSQ